MRYPPYDKNTVFLPEFDDNMETLKLRSAKNFCTKPHQHVVDLPYNPLISINYQQYGIQSWGNFNLSQPFFFSDFPMRAGFIQQALLGVFFGVQQTIPGAPGDEMRQVFKQWAIDKGLLRPAAQGARMVRMTGST